MVKIETQRANQRDVRKGPVSAPARHWLLTFFILLTTQLFTPSLSLAAITSITPITWDTIGLDSNTPAFGPNRFPVGARVCSNSLSPILQRVDFTWGTDPTSNSNAAYIYLRPFSNSYVDITIPAMSCADAYFDVEVNKIAASFDKTRRYTISAAGVSSPTPRELYVEHLVSQSRNAIDDMKVSTTKAGLLVAPGIPSGSGMDLVVGNTYFIEMVSHTATQGYEQLESFVTFPNTIFQVLSVESTYTADTTANVTSPNDRLYSDACFWENDPNSPNYRACNGEGKIGGSMTTIYQVKILSAGSGSEALNSLIHDFSGSSYHYNSDYSTGARFANLIDPNAVSISKKFSPNPTNINGVSVLTITLTNPNGGALSNVSFTDTFPNTSTLPPAPGNMIVATPLAMTNSCGGSIVNNSNGLLTVGDPGIKLTGGTIPAQSSCSIKINVTSPSIGTYKNLTGTLLVGAVDTGKSASDDLIVNNSPPLPTPVCGLTLAKWTFPTGFSPTAPLPTTANVTASASVGSGIDPQTSTATATADATGSWITNGSIESSATLLTINNEYFQFALNTTGFSSVYLNFNAERKINNSPKGIAVFYGPAPGSPETGTQIYSNASILAANTTWYPFGAGNSLVISGGAGTTYVRIYPFNSGNNNPGADAYIDDVTFTGCEVPKPPTLTKTFPTNPVAINEPTNLNFILGNPNLAAALSGVAFTDTLPAGLTFTSAASPQCGGTVTLTAPNLLTFSGGTLNANTPCTLLTTVTASTAGPHDNVSGAVTATQSGPNNSAGGVATASLLALAPPAISKSFSPNPIFSGGVSTLTFTLTNPNVANELSGVAFSDTFPKIASGAPGNMTLANLTTTNSCGAGLLQDDSGGSLNIGDPGIRLTGGTIPAGGSCTVKVNVTAPSAGTYSYISGPVSHLLNAYTGIGNSASDALWVEAAAPGIALVKEVGPTATGPWTSFLATTPGATIYYHYTVENYGDVPLTSVNVSDPDPLAGTGSCFWANLPVAVTANNNHIVECTSTGFAALAGSWQYTATTLGYFGVTTVTDTSKARYATAQISLVKNALQSTFKAADEILDYTFVVTNSGFAPLLGPVSIADNKANDEACPAVNTVGDFDNYLDPGEVLTCIASYLVLAADVTAKGVTNSAVASISGVSSLTVNKTVPLAPDLTIVKSNNVSSKTTVGASFLWTLTVTNGSAAGSPAIFADTQLLLQDDLPASGATYIVPAAATLAGGTTGTIACAIAANTLTCTASGGAVTIPPGGSLSIPITVTVTAAADLVNPRSGGAFICQVDPGLLINEILDDNNSCSDTITVAMPNLMILKTAQTYSDPINGTNSPKAIPGALVNYTIIVTNFGLGAVDPDTTVILDPIPANTELFVGDFDGPGPSLGPILFSDGATPSGLTYTFTDLASTTDNLAFSGDNGIDLYTKDNTADIASGCDPTVTNIKIPLSGSFNAAVGVDHPSFSISFRVRIK